MIVLHSSTSYNYFICSTLSSLCYLISKVEKLSLSPYRNDSTLLWSSTYPPHVFRKLSLVFICPEMRWQEQQAIIQDSGKLWISTVWLHFLHCPYFPRVPKINFLLYLSVFHRTVSFLPCRKSTYFDFRIFSTSDNT